MSVMPRPLLLTGTGTGVGKTWVARGLLRAMLRAGQRPMPLKLVETGCAATGNGLLPTDGVALARAAGRVHDIEAVAPERFQLAASPARAARAVHRDLNMPGFLQHFTRAQSYGGRVLIEGAGGLHTPITARETFADFAVAIECDVLVIARDALGTLNHTLLTVEALLHRNVPVLAVVLGPTEDPNLTNRDDLAVLLGDVSVFGPLPHIADASDDAIADALLDAGIARIVGVG